MGPALRNYHLYVGKETSCWRISQWLESRIMDAVSAIMMLTLMAIAPQEAMVTSPQEGAQVLSGVVRSQQGTSRASVASGTGRLRQDGAVTTSPKFVIARSRERVMHWEHVATPTLRLISGISAMPTAAVTRTAVMRI